VAKRTAVRIKEACPRRKPPLARNRLVSNPLGRRFLVQAPFKSVPHTAHFCSIIEGGQFRNRLFCRASSPLKKPPLSVAAEVTRLKCLRKQKRTELTEVERRISVCSVCSGSALVSTKIALLAELGARTRARGISVATTGFSTEQRRACHTTQTVNSGITRSRLDLTSAVRPVRPLRGHGTSSRGLAPTAIHIRPRWGRTATVAGGGHWGASEPPNCRLPRKLFGAVRGHERRGKPGSHIGHRV
jgi:hypothetical protein